MSDLRVLVADDQRIVRRGIATLVGMIDGVTVVATAADGQEAVELALSTKPDVALLDLRMPRLDGINATRLLRRDAPGVAVVILTSYSDGDSVLEALRAGACGYLSKESDIEEIERAIAAAAAGQSILSADVRQHLIAVSATAGVFDQDTFSAREPDAGFTPREREVLVLIAQGLSNREIADELVITEVTVKTHVHRVFAKSGSRDRAQAVNYAFRHGLAR